MKQLFLVPVFLYLLIPRAFAQQGWYQVANAPMNTRFDDLSVVNNSAWVASNFEDPDGRAVIYKSIDKGNTWFVCDTLLRDSANASLYVRSIEFITDSIGMIGVFLDTPGSPILLRTTDGGNSFSIISSPALTNAEGVCGMAHFGNTIIGVGIYDGQANFYKSTDAGVTWTVNDLSAQADGLVDCYMFNDSTYVICGRALTSQGNGGNILRTNDGGTTWQQVALSTSGSGYSWKMDFRPSGKGICSIQGPNNVFLTSDFGVTWTEQTVPTCTGDPFEDYGAATFFNDTLGWVANQYFGQCFYETRDGGATWTNYTFGNAMDRAVVLDSVAAMIAGNTIYKFSLDSIRNSTSITPIAAPAIEPQMFLQPNPANDDVKIDIDLKYASLVSIYLLDQNRKFIKQFVHEHYTKGKYSVIANVHDIPSGSYLVYMTTYQKHISSQLIVAH